MNCIDREGLSNQTRQEQGTNLFYPENLDFGDQGLPCNHALEVTRLTGGWFKAATAPLGSGDRPMPLASADRAGL